MDSSLLAISSRLEQLELKLGFVELDGGQPGDTVASNLAAAAQCLYAATVGNEKLSLAAKRAEELGNYTDPRYLEKLQDIDARALVVESAAPLIQHHCHCMQQCQKAAHVLSSDALENAATLEPELQKVKLKAERDQQIVDEVLRGISEVVSRCGNSATEANDCVAKVAKKLDKTEAARPK